MVKDTFKPPERTESVTTTSVKHTFSDMELNRLQKQIAKDVQDLVKLESDERAVTSDFGSKVNEKKATINSTAVLVNQGYEYRQMDCKVVFDWRDGIKSIIHPETGEVIHETKITPQERQTMLSIQEHTS